MIRLLRTKVSPQTLIESKPSLSLHWLAPSITSGSNLIGSHIFGRKRMRKCHIQCDLRWSHLSFKKKIRFGLLLNSLVFSSLMFVLVLSETGGKPDQLSPMDRQNVSNTDTRRSF